MGQFGGRTLGGGSLASISGYAANRRLVTDGAGNELWAGTDRTVDVSLLATGAGDYGDPFTGWEEAVDNLFAPDMTFLFPSGVYAVSGDLNFGQHANCRFLGEGGTVLLYVGAAGGTVFNFTATHATTNVDGEFGEHEATYDLTIENFILDGDSLADIGLFMHSIHHSNIKNIFVRNVVDTKFHFQFAILNVYENLNATRRVGDSTSDAPEDINCVTGIYLTNEPGEPINTVQECTFINTVVEFCTGNGIEITSGAKQNKFLGGAAQVCAVSLKCSGTGNTIAMDCEFSTTGVDYHINGNRNILLNCLATAAVNIGDDLFGTTPTGNEIRGGVFNTINIHNDAQGTLVDKPGYNFIDLATGGFFNRSASTVIIGAPYDVNTPANRYAAGFLMPDRGVFRDNLDFEKGKGVILTSPNGSRFLIEVDDAGVLSTSAAPTDSILAKSDAFTDNSIGAQWYKGSFQAVPSALVAVAESGSQLNITLPDSTGGTNYRGLVNTPHSIADTGRESVQVVSLPSSGSFRVSFQIGKSARNCLTIFLEGGTLTYGMVSGGSFSSIASVAYNAANHAFWSFLRDGTDIAAEVSADGNVWATLGTSSGGLPFDFNNFQTCIEAGSTGSSVFDVPVVFDDYVIG